MSVRRPRHDPDRVRDLFDTAGRGVVDDATRMADRVPDLLAEARRRRAATATLPESMVPVGARLLPAFGAVAAVLAVVALVLGPARTDGSASGFAERDLDRVLLVGPVDEATGEDPVFLALTGRAGGDDE